MATLQTNGYPHQNAVDEAGRPLIGNAYTSINSEIAEVTHWLREAAKM